MTASASASPAAATPQRRAGAPATCTSLVHVEPDKRFGRDGNDIFSTVDLTITQAALGTTVTVPTLDGDEQLVLEPGTQPGVVRVLRGKGMPCCKVTAAAISACSSTSSCRDA